MKPVHRMTPLWIAAIVTFVTMFISDILSTAMVIFEAKYEWFPAGVADALGYLTGLACSVLAINSIFTLGFRNKRSQVLIACAVSATFLGTIAGVFIVKALAHA